MPERVFWKVDYEQTDLKALHCKKAVTVSGA